MTKQSINCAFIWGACGSLIAMLSVAIGAFAAHGLKASMSDYQLGIIDTAAKYQMYHALAMLLVAACMIGLLGLQDYFKNELSVQGSAYKATDAQVANTMHNIQKQFTRVAALFTSGILLFSGSLYLLAFTGIKTFAFVTPIGGIFLLTAWVYLLIIFLRSRALLCS